MDIFSNVTNTVLEEVLVTLVRVLVPVLLLWVTAWVNQNIALLKAKFSAEQWAMAVDFAGRLVDAAEQSGITGELENVGEAKKEWVLSRMEAWLKENKIDIDLNRISDLVESLVFEKKSQVQ